MYSSETDFYSSTEIGSVVPYPY